MKTKLSIKVDEFFYYCAFFPYLIIRFLETTMFPLPFFIRSGSKYLLLFSILSILFKNKVSLRYLGISVLLILVSLQVWLKTDYSLPLEVSILMISTYKLNQRKLVQYYFYITSLLLLVTIAASQVGIIENLKYYRSSGLIRNSFGIIYPTDFASHVFYLCLVANYLYFHKYSTFVSVGSMLSAIFIYHYSDARLDSLSILFVVLLFNLLKKFNSGFFTRILSIVTIFSSPVLAYLSYYLSQNFNVGIKFHSMLDLLTSGRLYLGKKALDTYGVHFWGNNIIFIGNGGTTEKVINYNFVDSSYLKMLLTYGIVFVLLIVFITVFKSIIVSWSKDYYLMIVLLIVSINSLIAHHLIEVTYNIFLISLLDWEILEKNRGRL